MDKTSYNSYETFSSDALCVEPCRNDRRTLNYDRVATDSDVIFRVPNPSHLVSLSSCCSSAEECFQKGSKIADAQMAVVEMQEYQKTADPSDLLRAKKPATESAFQSSGETKPAHIHPTDPSAAPTHISTTLDSK